MRAAGEIYRDYETISGRTVVVAHETCGRIVSGNICRRNVRTVNICLEVIVDRDPDRKTRSPPPWERERFPEEQVAAASWIVRPRCRDGRSERRAGCAQIWTAECAVPVCQSLADGEKLGCSNPGKMSGMPAVYTYPPAWYGTTSVLVAVNVNGLPDTTIADPGPAAVVRNPEMVAGSAKLAFAVNEFAGPTPSVQFGTVASPVVPLLVSVVVVTAVELEIGPILPPPDVIVIVTEAPPSGV